MICARQFKFVLLAAWAIVLGAGFLFLLKYETRPGRAATPDEAWPAEASALVPLAGKPVLIMAAHPECPCSRASMAELAELAAKYPGMFAGYVLFEPAGAITADDCRASELWQSAAAIKGVMPVVDEKKMAIRVFHASTSGQILFFDAGGRLQFSGGITSARDHAGPSDGADSIAAFLSTGKMPLAHTPVYGCALESP